MVKLLDFIRSFIPSLENLPNLASISSFGPGWLFGAFGTIAISLFSLSIGKTRAVISLLSIYVAFAFNIIFPYSNEVSNIIGSSLEEYWIRLGLFLIAYVVVFTVFNFSFIRKRISSSEYSLFGIIILSFLQISFLASIIFNILPEELTSQWAPGFSNYFSTPTALFFWAFAPLLGLLFIKK